MLVRPFIQPIKAFDAGTQTGVANVCILGGDIITAINYQIYQGDTLIYTGSVSVTDNGGSAIRTFPIYLSQSMGLANNGSYTIRAWTTNATDTSAYSSVALFYCYVTPTITLKDSNNTTITSSYVFTAQSGTLTVNFAKNDNNSIATLNTFSMNIFGVDSNGNLNLVYSSGDVYTPFAVAYDNLTPTNTVSPLYASYQIQWTAGTTQGMELSGATIGLSCNYTIAESGNLISVENDSMNGRVKVNVLYNGVVKNVQYPEPLTYSPYTKIVSIEEVGGRLEMLYESGATTKRLVYNYNSDVLDWGSVSDAPIGSNIMVFCDGSIYYGGIGSSGSSIIPKFWKGTSEIQNPFSSGSRIVSMCVDGGDIYCCTGDEFAIFNSQSSTFGSPLAFPNGISAQKLLLYNNNIYCFGRNNLVVYNTNSGSFETPIEIGVQGIGAVCRYQDFFYVSGYSGGVSSIFAIDGQSLETQLLYSGIDNVVWSIIANSENVYCGMSRGQLGLYSIREKKFNKLQIFESGGQTQIHSLIIVGDILYFGASSFVEFQLAPIVNIRRTESGTSNYITLLNNAYQCSFYDYFARNNTLYDYELFMVFNDGSTSIETVQVLSQFCKSYIADGDKGYELYEEWGVDNFQRNQKTAIYEPYGSKYPFVAYNAVTNYDSGSDTAIYRSPTNVGQQYLDSIAQAQYTKQLRDFLTNRKVKVRKTESGDIALVAILNAVPNTYYKEMGNTLATTQFEWVEVGDFTDSDFKKLGITNNFTLYAQ